MIKSLQSTNWSGWIEGMDHHFVKPFPKCKELYQIEFPHMLVAWWNPVAEIQSYPTIYI